MSNKRVYQISAHKTLIDLNGDSVNFSADFRVVSANGQPFDIVIVDQEALDTNQELKYERAVQGQISGNVTENKNTPKNYFIVLKADQPCECEVEIVKRDVPPMAQLPVPAPIQNMADIPAVKPQNGFNWVKILLIVGLIAVGGFVLYWMSRKKSADSPAARPASPSNSPAKSPPPKSLSASPANSPPNPLLNKLRNLDI